MTPGIVMGIRSIFGESLRIFPGISWHRHSGTSCGVTLGGYELQGSRVVSYAQSGLPTICAETAERTKVQNIFANCIGRARIKKTAEIASLSCNVFVSRATILYGTKARVEPRKRWVCHTACSPV
jgi:hypothetical protein